MRWMSNKYLIEFLPHKLGSAERTFNTNENSITVFSGLLFVSLVRGSEFRASLPPPGKLSLIYSPLMCCAYSIRLIFSRETLSNKVTHLLQDS